MYVIYNSITTDSLSQFPLGHFFIVKERDSLFRPAPNTEEGKKKVKSEKIKTV